jgi:D-tyrosyl-tRNA(Tyr) deacylase
MKIVLQRVKKASVEVNDKVIAKIGPGLVLMLGIAKGDSGKDIDYLAKKIVKLRIFENNEEKFDKELKDINGEILVISQFTLFADCSKGKRPYFGGAEEGKRARELYEKFVEKLKEIYDSEKVKSGQFAARMLVEIHNDGPVTIILNSL